LTCWWSAAARPVLRRPSTLRVGIRTGVAAERFGGQVLDTMAIENFISVQETEGPKLATALEEHVKQYDVDIMNLQRADKLIPGKAASCTKFASPAVRRSKPRP
jgi:alkyl hydroperoxide reductase subunit F